MMKAERSMRTNSSMEQIAREQRKLMIINSMEKRTKAKGRDAKLLEKRKDTLKRNIEKMRKEL